MRNARARKHISVLSEEQPIFVQASAEPNDCVKPNEQNRVYSNFAMASNRTFKNLFGLCRAQPKMSRKRLLKTNVCARREQKPSLLGLCRAAAKRLLKTNKKSPALFPIICKYHVIKLSLQHIDFNSLKYHEKLFTHLAMLLAAGPCRHAAGTDAVGVERDL